MRCPDIPADETERLIALAQYGLDAAHPLNTLDSVVEVAVRLFDVPAAAVNLVGDTEVFFASSFGIGECDMRREVSFCAHAVNGGDVMVVPDARLDPRFHDNPLVEDGLIVFYAGVPLRAPSGHALGALCIVDARARSDLDARERESLRLLARLAAEKMELRRLEVAPEAGLGSFEDRSALSPDAVVGFDAAMHIDGWNARAAAMFGLSREAVIGQPLDILVCETDQPAMRAVVTRVLGSAELSGSATGLVAQSGDGATFEAEFVWLQREGGQFAAIVRAIAADSDERRALYDLSRFDSLTGLANHLQLRSHADAALGAGQQPALIFLDLRKFGALNAWQGHAVGDMVLCVVARRLRAVAPPGAVVARSHGSLFALLLPDCPDPGEALALARKALAAVTVPIVLGRRALRIECSCGVALAGTDAVTQAGLIARAEQALAQAKQSDADAPVCLDGAA